MEEIIAKVPTWINLAALGLSSLVVIASVVVRVTKSKKDDEVVGKVAGMIFKALKWLPTIGINPQTKELEKAYEELKQKK